MNYSDVKILFETLVNKDHVKNAVNSVKKELVSVENIENGDYLIENDLYYSTDYYVLTVDNGVCYTDDCQYCEGESEWFSSSESFYLVYEGRDETYYSETYIDGQNFYQYEGDYYNSDALSYNDLVILEDSNDVVHIDNAYYHDGEGYYSYPKECNEYTRSYHNGSYSNVNFEGKSKYSIGFEIEKEDQNIKESIYIESFEEETDNVWRKEEDGSLDSESGFELISPTFEFDIEKIFDHIESNNILVNHINASYSTSCGGHIHLSEKGLSGEELFDKIKGYTPLFYALYHGRVDKNYSKGKSNQDLKNDNEKYQAVKIHHNRVEFRIISAVPDVDTLKWRSKLLMMILNNPTNDVIKAYFNVDTKFTKLLQQVYSPEKLITLKERFIKYTKQFENITIKN